MKDTYLLFNGEYIKEIEFDKKRIIGYSTTKEKSKALKLCFDDFDEIKNEMIKQEEALSISKSTLADDYFKFEFDEVVE